MTLEPAGANSPMLVSIGDIGVTEAWVVTPSGSRRVGEVNWIFNDMSRTTTVIPATAIVLTILFVWFCLLGLLFLLMKEERTTGSVQVIVQGHGFLHATQLPVSSPHQVMEYSQRVNYARALGTSAQ